MWMIISLAFIKDLFALFESCVCRGAAAHGFQGEQISANGMQLSFYVEHSQTAVPTYATS